MICTCVRCGVQFEAKRKTAVCANCHTAVCVICGKEFQLQTPWTQKTCSSKCRAEYVKQSGIAKERAKRRVLQLRRTVPCVVSFSDVAHTRGNLYAQLGFVRCNESAPSYVWVDSITDKALNRVECQKSNLVKLLDEPDLDLSQTERQIMESHGYLRVYDSGTVRWEYHPN